MRGLVTEKILFDGRKGQKILRKKKKIPKKKEMNRLRCPHLHVIPDPTNVAITNARVIYIKVVLIIQ